MARVVVRQGFYCTCWSVFEQVFFQDRCSIINAYVFIYFYLTSHPKSCDLPIDQISCLPSGRPCRNVKYDVFNIRAHANLRLDISHVNLSCHVSRSMPHHMCRSFFKLILIIGDMIYFFRSIFSVLLLVTRLRQQECFCRLAFIWFVR